ncbi:ATP-dependent DNA ligase LigA [Natronomonas marina]|jgi:DNA ligase-1|uniref:ATP-dependent DNA ligase LigA n=1 Tax=Natronomonas marina TaxID=2961939 RepID=UPI0020C9480E|nr:ATP-dependent DNA ligase LigA [Natronomonas marina]
MEFAEFAALADEIEAEDADLEVIGLVAALFETAGEDLGTVTRVVQGRVFPAHDATKLDVGPSLCHEALAKAAGPNVSAADVEERLASVGEIGAVAESLELGGQRGLAAFGDGDEATLTVAELDGQLREIAAAEGDGSTDTKLDVLFGLFNRADPLEARFLARLVLGEMRVGVGEGTVRDAIAEAFDVPVETVARAIQVTNDCGLVAETARETGEAGLAELGLEVGRPVKAMLAQTGTAVDAIEEWESAAVETKFDGARVQVHYDGGETRLFSRNLEDVTDPLPEVVEFVERELSVPAILDGEVVAVDEGGDPLPFQEVLRRFRRKHGIETAREDVAVELHAFDCLHADGEDLLDAPLLERHERLADLLDTGISELAVTDDPDDVAEIEETALSAGHEGVMLKNPESAYTPGSRGKNWLKRKPDVETLDLVVTGAEWGEGRRANLFGTFELSARTPDGYATIGNVATGITDERLAELHELLGPHVRSESGTEVDVEPAVVFEVGYEEIQRSPTYSSGYALRFPRFVGVRADRDPANADTLERIERLAGD